MLRFLSRRLLALPLVLFLVNFLGFAYADFARYIQAGRNPYISVGVNPEPLLTSYRTYLGLAEQGFGEMPNVRGISILKMIFDASQASLGLVLVAFTVAALIGLFLGYLATRSDPPGLADWLLPFTTLGMAMPSFLTGGLLIAFTVYLALFSNFSHGFILPINGFGWDQHIIYPAIALALRPAVQIAQFTAVLLSNELSKQYVTVARALGHSWLRIRTHHALRNTLPGLVLSLAGTFRYTVVELILVETMFSWIGIGRLLGLALMPPKIATVSRTALSTPLYLHPPLVATLLTVFGLLFLLSDLVASAAAQAANPRLSAHVEEVGDG